jgi:hypothetical protein
MYPSASPKASPGKHNIFRKIILACFIAYFLFSILAGIVIADFSLKLRRLPLRHQQAIAAAVRTDFHAGLQDVTITAADGAALKGWFVHPRNYNGNAVILLHGITDNREGVAGWAFAARTRLRGFASRTRAGTVRAAVNWPPMALKNPMTFIAGFRGYTPRSSAMCVWIRRVLRRGVDAAIPGRGKPFLCRGGGESVFNRARNEL